MTGDEIYLMGIIDFLQFYNKKKRAETFFKGFKHKRSEISAVMLRPVFFLCCPLAARPHLAVFEEERMQSIRLKYLSHAKSDPCFSTS